MKRMLVSVMCILSFGAGLVLSGCESNSDSTPADVAGTWHGTVTQTGTSGSGTFTMSLTQNGSTVSGSVDGSIPVSGSVDGNHVTLTADTSSLSGDVNGNTMSGKWTDSDGTSGNWSATK